MRLLLRAAGRLAALFALVRKHGAETTAEFVEDLAKSVRNGEFNFEDQKN